jgi:xanthine dehydrogenase accessory factor
VVVQLDGVLRGLIRPGTMVRKGLKIGDIDPRGQTEYCSRISDKARSIGGAAITAILSEFNKCPESYQQMPLACAMAE